MSPQPKNTPEAPAAAKLAKGEHNPFLEGLISEGQDTNKAIQEWYDTRAALREQARQAVKTGFCTPEQAGKVEALWPMPKRGQKEQGEGETAAA